MAITGVGDYTSYTSYYAETKQTANPKYMAEQSVKLSISNEGKEYYRNSIQQNGQETYDDVLQRREQLKNEKISTIDYGYEISKKAAGWNKEAANTGRNVLSTIDRANGYVAAYAELYDEIIQGYEAGTREIYVADENGTRKLTRDEELSALDAAYKKTVDDFVTMEKTNQHAREIISEEMDKISKITSRSTLAAAYIEEQKTRGEDEIPENLGEKMYDVINFGENVSCGYHSDFKEYGVISFDYNGSRQVVPDYAVPKINTSTLSGICAVNNSLVLSNKSYYSWTTSSGGKYTWTVNNGKMGWAASESLLAENTNQKGTNYKWEMRKASNILSDLAQGKSVWGYLYSNEEVLSVCEKAGISPGFFSIDAGAGKHTYLLQESGKTINVDAKIKQLNDINWIEIGYKEGDIFSVYGKEYAIDSSGHINVSAEDEFTSTEIKYPSRSVE